MEVIQQVIGTLDQRLLIGIVVFLVILLIVSIVKKLVKLAVFIIALILVSTFVLPVAKQYQEKYNFRIEEGVAMITAEGKDLAISPDTCKGIKLNGKVEGTNNYSISIIIDDTEVEVYVPNFIQIALEKFANSEGIEVSKQEQNN